ncbi:hypothetical protein [Crocosphaera sp.]|uniref:hypothetical protein n=1 Tax=Crocosphaera sp. TaxID=2729996 RepID=UPI002625E30E|nr:hypothetical protein [Crocosphaera sp.]MDJ0582911.1 hypothetical protein [Crocosphaera sp.]
MKLQQIHKLLNRFNPTAEYVQISIIPQKGMVLKYMSGKYQVTSTLDVEVDAIAQMKVLSSTLKKEADTFAEELLTEAIQKVSLNENILSFSSKKKKVSTIEVEIPEMEFETPYEVTAELDQKTTIRFGYLHQVSCNNSKLPKVIFGEIVSDTLKFYGCNETEVAIMKFDLLNTSFDPDSDYLHNFVLPCDVVRRILEEKKPISISLSSWDKIKLETSNLSIEVPVESAHKGVQVNKDFTVTIDNIKDAIADCGTVPKKVSKTKIESIIKEIGRVCAKQNPSFYLTSDASGLGCGFWEDSLKYVGTTKSDKSNDPLKVELSFPKSKAIQTFFEEKKTTFFFPMPDSAQAFVLSVPEWEIYLTTIKNEMIYDRPVEPVPIISVQEVEPIAGETEEQTELRKMEQFALNVQDVVQEVHEVYCGSDEADDATADILEVIESQQEKLEELELKNVLTVNDIESAVLAIKTTSGQYFQFVLGEPQSYQVLFQLGQAELVNSEVEKVS